MVQTRNFMKKRNWNKTRKFKKRRNNKKTRNIKRNNRSRKNKLKGGSHSDVRYTTKKEALKAVKNKGSD